MGSKSGNVYKTPEDMAAWIAEETGCDVNEADVRRIAQEGRLADKDGLIGLYELIAYLAVVVK